MFPLVSVHLGYELAFVTRLLMGLGEGLIVPSVNSMISRWVPTHEKSTAASIFTIGNQLSGALGVPISAAFCASKFKWPGAYYFSAISGILWAVIWRLSVTNTPAKAKVMTKAERMYLERTLDNIRFTNKADRRVPWRAIFTSPAVLACFFSNFACNCIVVILVAYQPTFFKEVLLLPMIDNGIFSAAPHVIQIVVKLFWSITVDYLKRKHISNTTACKVSQGFASAVIGICLVLLAHFSDCQNPMVGIVIFCALAGGCATVIAGFYTSLLTLAPAYTGTLSSISMTVGIIGMAITPQLVGFFRVQGTIEEWRKIFYVLASLVIASGVTFVAFASGEAQPWGRLGPTTVKTTLLDLEQKKKPLLKPTELSEKSLIVPEV
ncbi:Protein T28F3.4 a [Aphelenchoides avenae]|nr:Protein T28F3.4 a [Aphelenchus avenae]